MPKFYMTEVFNYLVDTPPSNNKKVKKLAKYLRSHWGKKLDKLCVWQNGAPRTTNVAEGYNNGLQTAFQQWVLTNLLSYSCLSEPHPDFRKAFDVHIDDLMKNAYGYLRLSKMIDRPELRKTKNRDMDKKLIEAKRKLRIYLKELEDTGEAIEIHQLLK